MSPRLRLVLLSGTMLFVELALIRWTGSNIVYLSYFSNFVLLGSFLGIGVGFLRARARVDLWRWAPAALAGLVAFVLVFPVEIDRSGSQLIYFGDFESTGLPTWLTLPIIFLAVATTMAMIAEGVARIFALFAPLEAYRLDILGSIAGIVAFSALAFMRAPPAAWGAVVGLALLALYGRRTHLLRIAAIVAIPVMLTIESLAPDTSWSPYYRVTVDALDGAYRVSVNGIPHQEITSSEARRGREPIYFLVYERIGEGPVGDVLIVGAGTGSDVAIALSNGAEHVDAVEIDPRLYELGVELHPEHPYDDPRVDAFIEDARAFLERTDRTYDLILFALPDSLTLVSGQSSLRLESYLFTLDAMKEARAHLRSDGAFAMYNYYREPWLIDRLAGTLAEAYGRSPCVDVVGAAGGLALLSIGADENSLQCPSTWTPITAHPPDPVTDDYPFLYLKTRGIPAFYLLTIALILAASLAIVRVAAGPLTSMRPYVDLFFMGAAFLLIETKNVVQFALLFGTTWFVNALVFTGILVAVLAAVEVSRRYRPPRPSVMYAALLATLVIALAVPSDSLLDLAIVPRFFVAVAIAFAPVFLANLVFAQRFRDVGSSTVAFGANLLGAMVGGVLEYAALVTGYRMLLVVAGCLYGLAFVFGRRAPTLVPAA